LEKHSISAFHGTFEGGIKSFFPGSHFGSRHQALVRIGALGFMGERDGGNPYLYGCTLALSGSEIHHIDDWGTPNHQGALMEYLESLGESAKFIAYLDVLGAKRDPEVTELRCLRWLQMAARGHKALRYSNDVEKDGCSYMVLHSEDVSVCSCDVVPWSDVASAFRKTHYDQFGLGEGRWRQVLQRIESQD
jgi:hypothetical protein